MDVQIKNKTIIVSLLSVVALSISTFFLKQINNQLLTSSKLINGVDTCYKRSFQTFTAKLLQDSTSNYLSNEFISNTSNCYDEVKGIYDQKLSKVAMSLSVPIKNLKNVNNTFNEKIQSEESNTSEELLVSNIGSHFERVEKNKNDLIEAINKFQTKQKGVLAQITWSFYFFAALAPILLLMNLLRNNSLKKVVSNHEKIARELLLGADVDMIQKENLFESIFKHSSMENTLSLFKSYANKFDKNQEIENNNQSLPDGAQLNEVSKLTTLKSNNDSLVEFADLTSTENYKEQLNKSWTIKNSNKSIPSSDLSKVFLKAFDSLAAKLIDSNIEIDYKIPKETLIEGESEVFEQIICESISFLVNKLSVSENKVINFTSKNLGGTLLINIDAKAKDLGQINVNEKIEIVDKLISDVDGQYKLISNDLNSLTVQLIVNRTHEIASKRVTYIGKGSKKSILKDIKNQGTEV